MADPDEQNHQLAGVEEETAPEFIDRYLDSDSSARPDLWRAGIDELNRMDIAGGFVWTPIGPAPFNNLPNASIFQGVQPIGGEVTDIAIDPSGASDQVLYIATNNGGIWKTTNGGSSWFPTSDSLPSLSMGAVALDPSNPSIVYAGSGNLFDGEAGFVKAAGLYKSVDAGRTWAVADGGVFATSLRGIGINRIVVTAHDRLLVGAKTGLFRSIDGGLNFGSNITFDNGKPVMPGFVCGLAMDTTDANTAWVAIRGLDANNQPVTVGGLFKLTLNADGSVTPSANLLAAALGPVQFASIAFAQSTQPNNQTLYASVSGVGGDGKPIFLNLFTSTNSGAAWQPPLGALAAALRAVAGTKDREDEQANYDFTLGVDPRNPSLIYAGFKRIWSSANAGANFIASSQVLSSNGVSMAVVHWDQHELVFSPQSHWGAAGLPVDVWVGSDGGVARNRTVAITGATAGPPIAITAAGHGFLTGNSVVISGVGGNLAANGTFTITVVDADHFTLNGATGNGSYTSGGTAAAWTQLNVGAATHLFNAIDISRGSGQNGATYGGMQDNGTPGHRTGDPGTSWLAGVDGDGGVTAVDPANRQIIYGFDDTAAMKSTDDGNSWAMSTDDSGIGLSAASNTTPIVITAANHLYQTGETVVIKNVSGNTGANRTSPKWTITVIDANNFSLNGSAGTGNYTGGGVILGRRFGRNLQNPGTFTRVVALVPNGSNAATTMYISEEKTLRKSTNGGDKFNDPVRTFDDYVFSIVCPDANSVWVGVGDGSVHYSPDGGSSWQDFSPGGSGPVTGIAVDPAHSNRVVVVCAGFSQINFAYRTKHCFLTEDTGATWTDISGTDFATNSNLPDLPLHSVAFDGSTTPATIIVACDAGVLRSTNNGGSWQRLGTGVPLATCRSLAIDNTDTSRTPRLLRLGTYGRSCFERSTAPAAAISVEANLGFGAVRQGKTATLSVRVVNVSAVSLNITGFSRSGGSADFDFVSPPFTGALAAGAIQTYDIKFTPAAPGIQAAVFTLATDVAGSVQVPASGEGFASGKPRLSVNANLNFPLVGRGSTRALAFSLANTGLDDLLITQMKLSGSAFTIPIPPMPLTIAPGAQQSLTATYAPGTFGGHTSETLTIANTDPLPDPVQVPLQGTAPFNYVLLIVLIGLGAAVAVGAGVGIYEAVKSQQH